MFRSLKRISPMADSLILRQCERALRETDKISMVLELKLTNLPGHAAASTVLNLSERRLRHELLISRKHIPNCSKDERAFIMGHEVAHFFHKDTFKISAIAYEFDRSGRLPDGITRYALLSALLFAKKGVSFELDFNFFTLMILYLNYRKEMMADEQSARGSLLKCAGGISFFSRLIATQKPLSLKNAIFSGYPRHGTRLMNLYAMRTDMTGEKCHAVSRRAMCKDY